MRFFFQNEKEWLEARKEDVTSTDVAALFGLNPRKSRYQLWAEKSGLVENDFQENTYTRWGRRLQIPVGMGICEDEGWMGYDMTGVYIRHPSLNLGSSYDVHAECRDRGKINLEVKVAESFSEEMGWTKTVAPLAYEFQMQTQLHAAASNGEPFDVGCIGTLGRRQATRLYFREYDAGLGAIIDEEVDKFWKSVADADPPTPDFSLDGPLLDRLARPARMGESCNMSLNNRAVELINSWDALEIEAKPARKTLQEIEQKKNSIKSEIQSMMGVAETAIIGDFIVSAKEQLVDEKFVNEYRFRRFDVKKRKGK